MARTPSFLVPFDEKGSVPRTTYYSWNKNYTFEKIWHVEGTFVYAGLYWANGGCSAVYIKEKDSKAEYPVSVDDFFREFYPDMVRNNGEITGKFEITKNGPAYCLRKM